MKGGEYKMEEVKRLEAAVDDFAKAMKAKLIKKYNQGWSGWESMSRRSLDVALSKHAAMQHLNGNEEVDIANLCMFSWLQK